ncbi:cysteine desulfurase [Candidatus Saccharibacteria bacterium]|nr:cysteine desulfurase [Candidatus Saccharibacteria bacterium]
MRDTLYLDYAAATPLDPRVVKEMHRVEKLFANPSSNYQSGRDARNEIALARKKIAMFFGANSEEIVFTSGATEANNLAILGAARASEKKEIISIATEHASVRKPLEQLEKEGFTIHWCAIDSTGRVNQKAFENLLSQATALVTINYANSEIGTIQQIAKLVKIVRAYEKCNGTKIIFHTDASTALSLLNCDVNRLGMDLLTCSAAKIYGPKGVGLLYVRRGVNLTPLMYGGSQEGGVRSGTENINLIVGFSIALLLVQELRKKDAEKYQQLYVRCMLELSKITLLENGHSKDRIFSLVSICLNGISGENIVAYLDAHKIEIATGAACEASNDMPSAALLAIGRTKDQAQGSIRISFGRQTKNSDIDKLIECLKKTISALS